MTTSDLVKEMCQKQGISIAALAKNLGQTRRISIKNCKGTP